MWLLLNRIHAYRAKGTVVYKCIRKKNKCRFRCLMFVFRLIEPKKMFEDLQQFGAYTVQLYFNRRTQNKTTFVRYVLDGSCWIPNFCLVIGHLYCTLRFGLSILIIIIIKDVYFINKLWQAGIKSCYEMITSTREIRSRLLEVISTKKQRRMQVYQWRHLLWMTWVFQQDPRAQFRVAKSG